MGRELIFPENYPAARRRFAAASRAAGYEINSLRHDQLGPDGKELYTDCAYRGPERPAQLLVLISGAHGVETLCGSSCQLAFVDGSTAAELPATTGVLLIHALNCWGAAWLRRNTENNVDLCRNFIRFDTLPDFRQRYSTADAVLDAREFNTDDRAAADAYVSRMLQQVGPQALVESLMGGQYHQPGGFGFGGHQPEWSHQVLQSVLKPYADCAEGVAIIEYHSGLGPYGYGMAVSMDCGDELRRVRDWFGPWVTAPNDSAERGAERTHAASGHTCEGYRRFLPESQITAIVLEYGTYPMRRNLQSLLDDHWLHATGGAWDDPLTRRIKAEILQVHYPPDPYWRQAVLGRSAQVVSQAAAGLAGQPAYR